MKFKNCKYDHLQLAERFLLAAEKLMPQAKEEIDMTAGYLPVNRDQAYAEHFGFDSGLDFLRFAIHESDIWMHNSVTFYEVGDKRINPHSVGAIIERYLIVAKNLMEIKS